MKKNCIFEASVTVVFLLTFLTGGAGIYAASTEEALTAGVSDDVPPVCFRGAKAKLVGFDVDLLQEIGKRIARPVNFTGY